MSTQSSNQVVTVSDQQQLIPKLVTSKEKILQTYPDVFESIGCFSGPPNQMQLDQSITSKQIPCRPILVHLKEAFQQEIDNMLKAGVLNPAHEATLCSNSFVSVEGKMALAT